MRRVLLVDNGSLEPASTLQLRKLGVQLQARAGVRVDPVSLAHSGNVPAAELEGRPAELFEPALDRALAEGAEELAVVPLFVGPSHAIMRHVPALVAARQTQFPSARLALAPPLFVAGDARLARILADHIQEQLSLTQDHRRCRVAIVDHGSPSRAVTAVRDEVTAQVRALLPGAAAEVSASSMERRAGVEFDFNEPLLETLLARPEWEAAPLVVAFLFIAPGRHAGPGGDIAQILARVRGGSRPDVRFSRLLGEHPLMIDILADRVAAAFAAPAR